VLRNLYELNHKTVSESSRSMLHDLETIEKIFVEETTRKPRQEMPRLAQPPRKGLVYPARKGMEAVLEDQLPRRHAPPSTASIARRRVGLSRSTTPANVVGLTRMAKRQASLISPSILQRSPGKRVVVTRDRWLI
jgi:hypothetical protein